MVLNGGVDLLDRHGIQGWAQDMTDPDNPVSLLVKVDGSVIGRTLANLHRADLENAGIGDGRFGFALKLEGVSPLQPHNVDVVREADGAPLAGTPRVIPASMELDGGLQDHLATMFAHLDSEDTLRRWAVFLAQQSDHLLQRRADQASHKPHASVPREFRVRWSGPGPAPGPATAPRALVIDDALPVVDGDAGSISVLSHIRSLQRLGFEVVFAAADMKDGPAAAMLEAEGVTCCCAPWCASVEEVLRRERAGFALTYIHRGSNTRYLSLLRHYQPRTRIIYSVAELLHVRLARQAQVEERPELLEASQRVRMGELGAARFVDSVITHSSFQRAVILKQLPDAKVHVVPWSMAPRPSARPWAERSGLAFVGHYVHPADLDAAWWLIQDVMPLVRARNPAIECALAGSAMPDALRAASAPGFRVVGHGVDPDALFGTLRLTVAPLNFGAGERAVLDSLAAGLPCACTPLAAEGLDLPAALQAMVGVGAQGVADMIVRLHEDEAFNATCRSAGLAYVEANWSEARVDAAMRKAAGLPAIAPL